MLQLHGWPLCVNCPGLLRFFVRACVYSAAQRTTRVIGIDNLITLYMTFGTDPSLACHFNMEQVASEDAVTTNHQINLNRMHEIKCR